MRWIARAVIAKSHTFSCFNNKFIVSQIWSWMSKTCSVSPSRKPEVPDQDVGRIGCFWACDKGSHFHPSHLASGVSCHLWCSLAGANTTLISASLLTWHLPCLYAQMSSLHKDSSGVGWGPSLFQDGPVKLILSAATVFANEVLH